MGLVYLGEWKGFSYNHTVFSFFKFLEDLIKCCEYGIIPLNGGLIKELEHIQAINSFIIHHQLVSRKKRRVEKKR